MCRLRHDLHSTGELLAAYDPAPVQALFEFLQQLCSRDDFLGSNLFPFWAITHACWLGCLLSFPNKWSDDEPKDEKIRIRLQLKDPQLYQDLIYLEQMKLQNREIEQAQIQQVGPILFCRSTFDNF